MRSLAQAPRGALGIALVLAAILLAAPAIAQADFGILPGSTAITALNKDGTLDTRAGAHPYALSVHFKLKTDESGKTEGGEMRDTLVDLPKGLFGNPGAVPSCPRQSFEGFSPACAPSTQIGLLRVVLPGLKSEAFGPLYNLTPPPGVAVQLGFSAGGFTSLLSASVRTEEGYGVRVSAPNAPLEASQVTATIWGTPADPGHTPERGESGGVPSDAPLLPFLTLPRACEAPPQITVEANSKLAPDIFSSETAPMRDKGGNPVALTGCEAVPFAPKIAASPSSRLAESASGLDFELTLPNQGLLGPGAIAETEPERVEVTLPEGVTVNPSAAEGIGVCSEASYKAEQIDTGPGQGCPEASKLGSIIAHSPLLKEPIEGALYLAEPYENPTGSLIALYLVARAPERGVLVKQAGKVEPDPKTGQLITTFEDLPPLPYSDFTLHFREGGRAPLVTPSRCGQYETVAELTPFSTPNNPYTAKASFQIERGVNGGACPPAGTPPFGPGFEAGSVKATAGHHSPFYMRLTRRDGDQDLTKFSAKLPPGVVAKLAGTSQCPQAAITQARLRTGPHGGGEELSSPSCPASSQIGTLWAGAGVGALLTYVPGRLYLAGPYQGAPLSVVAIVPAVAGPFDVGTVVTQEALRIDPLSAEVEADGSASDPIPHILRGIPLKVRDIRVFVDKPEFTLNPTDCKASQTKATAWGGGLALFGSFDDQPFSLTSPFQVTNCARLGFKPRLSLKLKGGTRRGDHPALTGTFKPRKGDANLKGLALRLPRSAFLDQAHIRTICTRVQFAANGGNGGGCPPGAIYGKAKAFTPLLEEPLEGPVYLRSSNHNLPDFVAALHGMIDVEAVARIDSKRGGIRATFPTVPDAPLSKVVVQMQGGKKGLIVNSRNLCASKHRANIQLEGHNGKRLAINPVVGASCGKAQRSGKRQRRGSHPR